MSELDSPSGGEQITNVFNKPLSQLDAADIQRVVAEAVPEGSEVEYKESLPAKDGKDPWLVDQTRIGERSRNEVLAEIVAFANAYGGTLILGIEETDEKPARASAIRPIPACAELAERMRLQSRDCIEPQIPMLDAVGVPTESDGAGVVIFRVPRSRMGPHRHSVTRECYVRRADRTEKMTMREIQDLTLQLERGIAAIEQSFEQRSRLLESRFAKFHQAKRATALRATAIPLAPLLLDKLYKSDRPRPPLLRLFGSLEGSRYELIVPAYGITWRPNLRGISGSGGYDDFLVEIFATNDGLLEYRVFSASTENRGARLFPGWVMGLVGNALCGVELLRRAAGAADVEFGMEFEVWARGGELPIALYGGGMDFGRSLGPFPEGRTVFPRYSVGDASEFVRLAQLIEHDFWNAAGQAWEDVLTIDFADSLRALGIE